MKYRAEIDGLRAVAVIPVILFHAGVALFSGGFVGVDVFFVISGYLITTILIDDIENDRFSIVHFYERRARRILPALFFVMLVCLPFAWMWLLPSAMKDFSESLVAVSLFSSNILFWLESGYFDVAAEQKPLLHTWSLAVEEQYYLLFPVFLYFAWRFGKEKVFWIIVGLAGLSLTLSEWGWRHAPSANFYLAPTRAWELFAGSIAAFLVKKNGVQPNNPLSLLGLGAIIFAILFYDETTPFPSIYALVPVGGVVLLILFASKETIAAKILGARVFVGIGLISYSAYLWHQPLFAFAKQRMLEAPSLFVMLGLSAISLVLAWFSWRFIERPFRNQQGISRGKIFAISLVGIAFFVVLGLFGHLKDGKTGRFEQETFLGWKDRSACVVTDGFASADEMLTLKADCFDDENNFILIGDSHAASLSKQLRDRIETSGGQLVSLIDNACSPIAGTTRVVPELNCDRNKQTYWDFIEATDATVIFSARWRLNLVGTGFNNREGGIEHAVNGLNYVAADPSLDLATYIEQTLHELAQTRPVIVMSQIPETGWHVPERLAKLKTYAPETSKQVSTAFAAFLAQNESALQLMDALAKSDNITVIQTETLVCDVQIEDRCMNTLAGASLYRDHSHPSPLYAEMIADVFGQMVLGNE